MQFSLSGEKTFPSFRYLIKTPQNRQEGNEKMV